MTAMLSALILTVSATGSVIENDALRVTADPASGALEVFEKRSKTFWRQITIPAPPAISIRKAPSQPSFGTDKTGWPDTPSLMIKDKTGHEHPLYLAWDSDNFYAAAEVNDPAVVFCPPDQAEYWKSDGLELWLGGNQVTAFLSGPPPGAVVRKARSSASKQPERATMTRIAGGYRIMVAIPWENIEGAGTLESGESAAMAFAAGLNFSSNAGARDAQAYYPQGWVHGDLTTFADAQLTTDSSMARTPRSKSPAISVSRDSIQMEVELPAVTSCALISIPCSISCYFGRENGDLAVEIVSSSTRTFSQLLYPWHFAPPSKKAQMVFPGSSGLLLPMRKDDPAFFDYVWNMGGDVYDTQGIVNACLGMIEPDGGQGMLMIFDTPWLAHYRMLSTVYNGQIVILPGANWHSNLGRFDKAYRLIFHFSPSGDYVSLAKRYRRHMQAGGTIKTLAEKVGANPEYARAMGAPVFWLAGRPDEVLDVARMMRADGISRAIINIESYYYDTLGRPDWANELSGVIRDIRAMGYLVSRYDQYRDTHPKKSDRIIYQQWHTDAYDTAAIRDENGNFVKAFGPDARTINQEQALDMARAQIPACLKRYPYNAFFIDTIGYVAPVKEVDWRAGHRLDASGVVRAKGDILKYAGGLGLVVGTEGCDDWVTPYIGWQEGNMTINQFAWGHPGWGYQDMPSVYEKEMNPDYRIPFSQLVVGGCVTQTWRWEDGMDRYPQYWQRKNLWNVLYAGVPMYFLNRDAFMRHRTHIANTDRYVNDWVRSVACDEMVSHRFITPDRMVQETCFSSGRGVTVNFGAKPAKLPDGMEIKPNNYLMFIGDGASRQYSQPPVEPLDYDIRVKDLSIIREDFERGYSGSLDVIASQDRIQWVGITSDTAKVISGRFSAYGENTNPRSEWNEFMQTNRYLAPFKPGEIYHVKFDYRVLDASLGKRMYCIVRCGLAERELAGDLKWYPKTGESGCREFSFRCPDSPATQLFWGIQGTGKLAIDNVEIRQDDNRAQPGIGGATASKYQNASAR